MKIDLHKAILLNNTKGVKERISSFASEYDYYFITADYSRHIRADIGVCSRTDYDELLLIELFI